MFWRRVFNYFSNNIFALFTLIILGNSHCAFSSAGTDVDTLKQNKDTLRHLASVIFNREKDITYIQDKICTHSPQLFDIWKENKWQTIDSVKRSSLSITLQEKYKIVPSQTRRLLQRDDFSLLDTKIIENYIEFGNKAIQEAKDHDITLLQSPGNKRWSIKILIDFTEQEVGKLFQRSDLEHPISTNTLNLDIDVHDII
jgi:hypothetical protein